MTAYVFGANILENLTTGMYQDSKVIYREYIQNSCDQIDKAVREGILRDGDGLVDIQLDVASRSITIEDNATGIPADLFVRTLGNIADSNKVVGEDKGFRGIGRLCGLAYCSRLVFTSSAKGERKISTLRCDAAKMRELIEKNVHGEKHTANEVLSAIYDFDEQETDDLDAHFFRVEMFGINAENSDLLDFQQVKEYLSFVAPVPYQNTFYYRSDIYKHAKALDVEIDEYKIELNGEPVFKTYSTILKETSGTKYDDIFNVYFEDFFDEKGKLFAWMWFGLCKFQKAIPPTNQMRGLRLRKDNIQIGGENVLQKLFKEDRGNNYFIGEVFAIDKELIPNSQRDYFNETPARVFLERKLRTYFNDELNRLYRQGSEVNTSYKKIDLYEKKEAAFKEQESNGFIDNAHHEREKENLAELKKDAAFAQEKIDRIAARSGGLMQIVTHRIVNERQEPSVPIETPHVDVDATLPENTKPVLRTDKLSRYSKSERKLISKIFNLILAAVDSETAEKVISQIEEGLQ